MEYQGELYGKIAGKYPKLKMTTDDVDKLQRDLDLLKAANDDVRRIAEERNRYQEALEIIAGEKFCPDNLLGNVDIAKLALSSSNDQGEARR